MQICLVRCPSPFLIDDRAFPPLGLMAVATGLQQRGHEVIIHDGEIADIPLGFDAYGFGPTTPEYPFALWGKQLIKNADMLARVVIGGAHATLNPAECRDDGWDCIVLNDGELASTRAFEERLIYYIDGGEDHSLDEYPIIDRNTLDIKSYTHESDGKSVTTIMTSRGCPSVCGFCCKTYKHVRMRSADKIIEEIKYLRNTFGYEALAFCEDVFILDRERVERICACLYDMSIIWRCLVRADLIVKYGPDFIKMMADSGCTDISMGIESGSNKILKTINKGESVDTIKFAIRMIQRAGIRAKGFFIVGLPGETMETLQETELFIQEMGLDNLDVKIYQPYPGSPIWENRHNYYDIGWHKMDYGDMFYRGKPALYCGSIYTSALTTQEIVDFWNHLNNKYGKIPCHVISQ